MSETKVPMSMEEKAKRTAALTAHLLETRGFVIVQCQPWVTHYKVGLKLETAFGFPTPKRKLLKITKRVTRKEWNEQYKLAHKFEPHLPPKWKVERGEKFWRAK